jgi:hypothetical protein
VRRILPALPWLLLALAIVDWLGLKGGVIRHPTWVLGILVALATLALATRAVAVSRELRNPRRGRAGFVGELLLMAGVLTALGGGLANWLLSLQGYVVLHEGESVPLHGGSHLQQFDSGPLSRIEELHLTLGLAELNLIPTGDELFYPESRLTVRHGEEQSVELAISPGDAGSFGALRFYQGAFGFAPGIVIERDDRTVFDRIVPFVTERHGPTGISFIGSFTIASEELEVDGAVDLGSLDAGPVRRDRRELPRRLHRSQTLVRDRHLAAQLRRCGQDRGGRVAAGSHRLAVRPVEGAMKSLTKILVGGFLAFIIVALAQEWESVSSSWFRSEETEVLISEEERKAAADSVHLVLTLIGHLYGSGGDPRFVERIPASEGVLEEVLADIAYLRRNHRRQEMLLDRLEIVAADPLDVDRVEIRTREYWQVRLLWITGSGEADPPRAITTHGKYLVVRGSRGWRVEGWDLLEPETPAEQG